MEFSPDWMIQWGIQPNSAHPRQKANVPIIKDPKGIRRRPEVLRRFKIVCACMAKNSEGLVRTAKAAPLKSPTQGSPATAQAENTNKVCPHGSKMVRNPNSRTAWGVS